ncbi:MAG TPA: DUF1670 domain-containing protein [Anaerolineales bacterium]|nr:DUF1670 domain-containing protein [Anaerolineales bacterium]
MKSTPYHAQVYRPMLAKTLPQRLSHWLAEEFPHLGGPKVRDLFVSEVMRLIEAHYVPSQRLQPGQTLWYAVDKTDLPHAERSMAETRLVPVILTLVAREDLERLIKGVALPEVRRHVVARLHREAEAQGGVLAATDTSLLLSQSPGAISKAIRAYEQAHACVLPRRGTLHDLGRSVSHKALIAKKALLEAKSPPDVAWETAHSVPCTERYLVDLMRTYISLQRRGMSVEETAFATGLSVSLVKEYAALIAELGLTDDQLPGIIADLERTARVRQQASESGSSSCPAPSALSPPK